MIGAFSIATWSLITSFIFFYTMNKFDLLRVTLLTEIIGLDIAEHGSKPEFAEFLL